MMRDNKGVSLIALIITIAVLIIVAGAAIQSGTQRTDDAKLAKHNQNISMTQEEVENYYYYKGTELPVVNLTPYSIPAGSSLMNEVTKNNEQNDTFYIVDLSKLGKTSGKDGSGSEDDIYIVSSTRHNVYYVRGTTIKSVTYHGLISKNDVKLAQIVTPTPSASSYAYNNPKIPSGFGYISGTWDDGYTIEDAAHNQFVWVPVGNFTLGAKNINIQFQRTAYRGETFGASNYYETDNIANITNSVNTYGGFYIAKYEASNNAGKAESKADKAPWVNINWTDAKTAAEAMDNTSEVESVLCYGAHWDTALQWLIQSGAKTPSEVTSDSTTWGNYSNDSFSGATGVGNAGQWSQTGAKGMYDLAGNVWEWTMENYTISDRVYRGGYCGNYGYNRPAAYRDYNVPTYSFTYLGFRCALYLK